MSLASTPLFLSAKRTAVCVLFARASASSIVLPVAVADIETVRVSGVPVTVPLPVTVIPVVGLPPEVAVGANGVVVAAALGRAEPRRYAASSAAVTSATARAVRRVTVIVMPLGRRRARAGSAGSGEIS